MSPHKKATLTQQNQMVQVGYSTNESNLYLVAPTKQDQSLVMKSQLEISKIQLLEEQVRKLSKELAFMSSLIDQKERLLQNFHVREQELKASMFYPS